MSSPAGFFASINGHITSAEHAKVSVFDTGFLFGDGAYETLRTYGGRPFALPRHLLRLRNSAARLHIAIPCDDRELGGRVEALLQHAGHEGESYVRLIVSRGVGDASYDFARIEGPTVAILTKPFTPRAESCYREGVAVALVSIRRNSSEALDPAVKACNLLNNVLATSEARSLGADEAILLNARGDVAEGAGSNVFIVHGAELLSPPLSAGILPGITRQIVFELAAELGVPARERMLRVADLLRAEEAFLTSTTREVMPIRSIDAHPLGSGRPGPVTLRLLEAYRKHVDQPSA